MATTKVTFDSRRLAREIKADLNARLATVGELVVSDLKQKLSTSNQGGAHPSMPHEYPHAGTGRLRNATMYSVDTTNCSLDISIPVEYAQFLTTGTKHLAARKMIIDAVRENRGRIIKIMTTPRKGLFARAIGAVSDLFRGSPGDFTAENQ
jgi:hypothetical protein